MQAALCAYVCMHVHACACTCMRVHSSTLHGHQKGQAARPSGDTRTNRTRSVPTLDQDAGMKRKDTLTCTTKWKSPENTVLRESAEHRRPPRV